jgi:hypothetical protein
VKITITMDVDDEYADPGHEMGVTEEGYVLIVNRLSSVGDDIDVKRGE